MPDIDCLPVFVFAFAGVGVEGKGGGGPCFEYGTLSPTTEAMLASRGAFPLSLSTQLRPEPC